MRYAPALVLCLAAMTTGCVPDCVEKSDLACEPLYDPTFDNVFERTLKPTCGAGGSSCHSTEGHKEGIIFANADESYATLMDGGYIDGGDAECSELMVRIDTPDIGGAMPPGEQLDEAERCAIRLWVAEGANR